MNIFSWTVLLSVIAFAVFAFRIVDDRRMGFGLFTIGLFLTALSVAFDYIVGCRCLHLVFSGLGNEVPRGLLSLGVGIGLCVVGIVAIIRDWLRRKTG